MESYLYPDHFDLASPDGCIIRLKRISPTEAEATVEIKQISSAFVGFQIDPEHVFFNIKSTLAQLGVNGLSTDYFLDRTNLRAEVKVVIRSIGAIAQLMLDQLEVGAYIGKLFAADPRRIVRDPDYLLRMFGRADQFGNPLLSLGGPHEQDVLLLEKVEGRTVACLKLQDGILRYDEKAIAGFLPTMAKALLQPGFRLRTLIQLNQNWQAGEKKILQKNEILLVRTSPLHIRTVFGKVVEDLLPKGVFHTSACVLEPDTQASGDVYELFGSSHRELKEIPLEFYTLEPHREHVFFEDRDQLQSCLENPSVLFKAFETAPCPMQEHDAVFVVKGEQLLNLRATDWICREPLKNDFPGLIHPGRQAYLVERYIQQQPSYPFLRAIEKGLITSQGILLVRYFPSPLMKRMLLSDSVQRCLKAIYFQFPSFNYGDYFSHEDRSMLLDLAKFAIPVFWVDKTSGKVLQYIPKPEKDAGMFVPEPLIDNFIKSTTFGVYGSTHLLGNFEKELNLLLEGIKKLRQEMRHPLLNKDTPLALVTGGGPGLMEVGNRVAIRAGFLSCADIVDFRKGTPGSLKEQNANPYIEAKMTYRIDRLVERQAEFNLDFPIFLTGGIGTDFEYSLEEVRRKIGSVACNPVLLFGTVDYWKEKVTHRFQCNLKNGTISGSEWVSNCFYCVQTAAQGLAVYRQFLTGKLPIGPNAPVNDVGFVIVN